MDIVCALRTKEAAPPAERTHTGWPGRRAVAACFGGFTVYAGLDAVFTGHADRAWAVWAFGGYAIATLLLWFGRTWLLPLATTIVLSLMVPLFWLVTQQPATAEVTVIGRSADHLLKYGTPYLPPSQLSDWKAYNPYLPVMEVFGLPRSAGLAGVLGDPRIWMTLLTAALLAAAFALTRPHRFRDCAQCRRHTVMLATIALASPVFGFPLAVGVTDPPIIALLCLALAFAYRARWAWSAAALAVACAMKSTAWAAVPVLAVLAWVRHAPGTAARFTMATVAATGLLSLIAAPGAMAQTDAFLQNTVAFPLGLTKHKTPAESPLPGHMLAMMGPTGHLAAITLMAVAAVAFAAWLLLRPPRTAVAAGVRLAVGYAVVFILDPASRFGYFSYPLGLLAWAGITALSAERIVPTLKFRLSLPDAVTFPARPFRRPRRGAEAPPESA